MSYRVEMIKRQVATFEPWRVSVTDTVRGVEVWTQVYRHHRDAVECVAYHEGHVAEGGIY